MPIGLLHITRGFVMSEWLSEIMLFAFIICCMMFFLYLANLSLVVPSKSHIFRRSSYSLMIFIFIIVACMGCFYLYQYSTNLAYGLGFLIPSILALLLFLPAVRQVIARQLPIMIENPVHTLALVFSMIIVIDMWTTLAQGLEHLNQMTHTLSITHAILNLWSQDVLLGLLSMIGVGWLSRRTFLEACQRLGFKKPTWTEVGTALGIALLLSIFSVGMEQLSVWTGFGTNPQAEEINQKMLGSLDDQLLSLLILGIGAAIGEEAIYRGALQPRFGIIFTTMLFTISHNSYGISVGTFVVFVGGLVIGWTRLRYHLVSAMIVHASYNIFISMLDRFINWISYSM